MSKGILLDTVTFVDFLRGSLRASIRKSIEESDRRYLSVVTPWEIHLKKALRDRIRPVDITTAMERIGLEVRTILLEDLWLLGQLPEVHGHRDPFDRMLIAQAITHGLTIVSSDRRFSLYPLLTLIEY